MSINLGGGQPPLPNLPNNLNPQAVPAVQQPNPAVRAPVVSPAENTVASTVPWPAVPASADEMVGTTEPKLSSRDALAIAGNRLNDWQIVQQAIKRGDIRLVHEMLNRGLQPSLGDKDDTGQAFDSFIPKEVFKELRDIELFDRFIELFTQHGMQEKLYRYTSAVGNGILLKRLIQSGVEGWSEPKKDLENGMIKAIHSSDSTQLAAYFRIWKENCPICKPDWGKIFGKGLPSTKEFPDTEVLRVLIRELDPSRLWTFLIVKLFNWAIVAKNEIAVRDLITWMGEDFNNFLSCRDWKEVRCKYSPDQRILLAQCGFPPYAIALPLPSHESAMQFQLALFGPGLSKGAFATMLREPTCSSLDIVDFISKSNIDLTRFSSPCIKPKDYTCSDLDVIAFELFKQGLAPSLASKLALAVSAYGDLRNTNFLSDHRLSLLACLNECVHPDAFELLQEPISIEQARTIHDAVLDLITKQFGDPAAFFAAALACVQADGTIDTRKLTLIYGKGMGLPSAIVRQIGITLQALSSEVMISTVPPNLVKPGMRGVDLQKAFHDWILQGIARLMITRLPHDIGIGIARRDRMEMDKQDMNEQADAWFEIAAPINYLVTSVVRQYGQTLAQDGDGSGAAILEAFRAIPADAFKFPAPVILDDSSDDEGEAEQSSSDSTSPHPSSSASDDEVDASEDAA